MFIFKTSGQTFDGVIQNQKHAFSSKPSNWDPGEIVLVSKNKRDCLPNEKQIMYSMRLENIREASDDEIESYWPGNKGRWVYIIDCYGTERIPEPFDLDDVLGYEASVYKPVMTFRKIKPEHERVISSRLFFKPSYKQMKS